MSRLLRTSPPAPAAPPGASSSTPTRRYPRPPAGDWPPFYPLVKEHRVLVVRPSPAGVRSRAGSTTSPTPSPPYLLPNIPTAATKFRPPLHNPRAGQNFGEFFLKSVTQKTGPRETGPMLFLRRP